jgi:mycothione reductase
MKKYDLISIGTGSAMTIVEIMIQQNPKLKVAVIDKDEPGGICLTRGCIPSKILLYSAELVRTIEKAKKFGINSDIKSLDFKKVMKRMRNIIDGDINKIRQSLSQAKNIDYYPEAAEFVKPYTLKVGKETIKAKMIILCTGSKPSVPPIKGIENVSYLTSDTILKITEIPKSIAIVGGGYIAAEYGHFLSSMGAKVMIIGRNPQFIPTEEPEISALAKRELEEHMTIYTGYEVREAEETSKDKKLVAVNRESGAKISVNADAIMIASGRTSLSDVLKPEKGGIKTNRKGWISVNEYLETSISNTWAIGDANGKYPFKHVANY